MAKVGWTDPAVVELIEIADYIRQFDPVAADAMAADLRAAAASLSIFPNRGRPASRGCRELVNVRPYIIRYRVRGDTVTILRVRHHARRPLA